MEGLIASNIWKHSDKFGNLSFFAHQFAELQCIAIKLPNKLANVHSMHFKELTNLISIGC